MNELSQFLVDSILKEDEDNLGTVALFGGGFKPPTKGHLEVVLQGLKENPEVKQVYILVGSGARNGVTQAEAVKIWEIYQKFIPVASQIIPVQSPFSFFKTYLTDHKDEKVYVFIGARPDNEEDDKDVAERSAYVKKYSENAIPVKVQTKGGVSGTMARKAALSGNNEEFISYFPSKLSDKEKQEIIDMISSVVNEALFIRGKEVERIEKPTNNPEDAIVVYVDGTTEPYLDTVDEGRKKKKDPKKGTGKKPEGSGRRLYTDEDPKDTVGISFKTKEDIVDTLNKASFKAKSHARQSQIINLIHQRVRAAYGRAKDPETKARLKRGLDYIEKRKEASKEKTKRLQAQKESLNENASYSSDIDYKEHIKELTKYMIEDGWNILPLPKVVFKHGDSENARDFFGKTAYYDPNTKTIVLYTEGRHPKDIVRSFSHEMVHHEQNLEGRLGDIYTTNTQEDDKLNDIEKEANLNGTMTFRNWTDSLQEKKKKDPFGLNQFARELMAEGAYDSLTTKLTRATIQKWVEDSKKKPIPKKSFVDIDIDEFDGKGREIEFNYVGIVEFDKKIDGYEVDGTSNSGEDKGKMPFVATMFKINPKILPQAWSKISADVSDVIRHEIEHLTQAGDNTRSGKYMEDDIMIRDMINKLKILPKSDYYKLEKEVDAMLQGLYLKAKKTRKPFADVINNYLDIAPGIETKEDKEMILNLWRSRRKALSLPVFETETGEMPTETSKLFKIFLDMDGVIVDFDKRFEEQFGMPPREFEDNFGSDKFWEKIDSKGVGFWRGMEWMPGGQQLYNRVAKHDHALLSSPSRSDLSKIGKRMWRKDNTPNTKLILARSYNKKNYADKSNILIDDRADNIQQWKDAGGIGILYQSADQVMKELDKLGL